jgi:flagellar basal body-associated protein FliL
MSTLWIILAVVFVLFVLAFVAYGLFEVSPLAHHVDRFRDPQTGRRRWQSPHLETRDEYEHTHDTLA